MYEMQCTKRSAEDAGGAAVWARRLGRYGRSRAARLPCSPCGTSWSTVLLDSAGRFSLRLEMSCRSSPSARFQLLQMVGLPVDLCARVDTCHTCHTQDIT
jgi:hypothetical protein